MFSKISSVLTGPQRQALLASKIFNGIDNMSIRCAGGFVANSLDAAVTLERGRCLRIKGNKSTRINFVRSNMGGWGIAEISEEATKSWQKPKAIEFSASFGLVGQINIAHELLLCLQESGLTEVKVQFAGYNGVALQEIYQMMGIDPGLWCASAPETISITTLLKLCFDLKRRQDEVMHGHQPNLSLDQHLVGNTNVYP